MSLELMKLCYTFPCKQNIENFIKNMSYYFDQGTVHEQFLNNGRVVKNIQEESYGKEKSRKQVWRSGGGCVC